MYLKQMLSLSFPNRTLEGEQIVRCFVREMSTLVARKYAVEIVSQVAVSQCIKDVNQSNKIKPPKRQKENYLITSTSA